MIDKIKAEIESLTKQINSNKLDEDDTINCHNYIFMLNICLKWAEETEKELKDICKKEHEEWINAWGCDLITNEVIEKAFHTKNGINKEVGE